MTKIVYEMLHATYIDGIPASRRKKWVLEPILRDVSPVLHPLMRVTNSSCAAGFNAFCICVCVCVSVLACVCL
jgi:hypothetical protein